MGDGLQHFPRGKVKIMITMLSLHGHYFKPKPTPKMGSNTSDSFSEVQFGCVNNKIYNVHVFTATPNGWCWEMKSNPENPSEF